MKEYEKGKHPNICSFIQDTTYGKTLEYQMAFDNETNVVLITPSLQNATELKEMMNLIKQNKSLDDLLNRLRDSEENERIKQSINNINGRFWGEIYKKKAIIASRYLNSVEKGENALELSVALKENLSKKSRGDFKCFKVPTYIQEAIEWLCEESCLLLLKVE